MVCNVMVIIIYCFNLIAMLMSLLHPRQTKSKIGKMVQKRRESVDLI